MYIQEPKILGVFVSDVQAWGFWALGGLKPSKIAFRQAGGRPRLGHDISLVISTVLFVAIFCFKFHASLNNKNAIRLYTYMSKGLQGEIIYTLVLGVLPLTQVGKIFEIITSKTQ